MSTMTKLWKNSKGVSVPVCLMDDDYLKNAYRRCVEITYGNVSVDTFNHHRSVVEHNSPLTIVEASEWKIIFETEFKRRKIITPRIDKDTYSYGFGVRIRRKQYMKEKNKNFDDKFS